ERLHEEHEEEITKDTKKNRAIAVSSNYFVLLSSCSSCSSWFNLFLSRPQTRCLVGKLLDLRPIAGAHEVRRGQPGAADAHDVRQTEPVARTDEADAAGRTEADCRQRSGE